MRVKSVKRPPWFLVLGLILYFPVVERASAAQAPPEQAQGIAKAQTEKGISYLSGGVSSEEREQIKQWAKDYNLGLTFAGKSRQYLSDVSVVVLDEKGNEVVSAVSNGPWFYVQLPPGSYQVKVSYKGQVQTAKNIRLAKAASVRRTFVWDVE
jgi:hypothetical protein